MQSEFIVGSTNLNRQHRIKNKNYKKFQSKEAKPFVKSDN